MATKRINNLGSPFVPFAFHNPEVIPYMIDESDGVTYLRYHNTNPCAIIRISKSGSVTSIEWSYGAWDDRSTLVYKPINETMTVDTYVSPEA